MLFLLRILLLIGFSGLTINLYADRIDSVDIVLPGYACSEVQDQNGNQVYKNSDGDYVLQYSYDFDTKQTGGSRNYSCYSIKGKPLYPVNVSSLYGTFALIDPDAWFNIVVGGLGFLVDQKNAPCDSNISSPYMSIAYASDPYNWCDKMSKYGYSSNFKDWWVNNPNITLPAYWNEISLILKEWYLDSDQSWDSPDDSVVVNVMHKYKSPPTPQPDLDSTKLVIHGNDDISDAFYLIDADGNHTSEVSSLPVANNAWYRVATSNNVSTFDPYEIDIGMPRDSIQALENADYTCELTMASTSDSHTITSDLSGLIDTNDNYPGYLFFKSEGNHYTPSNNSVTFTLDTKCTSRYGGPDINFHQQKLTLYRVSHFASQ